MLCGVAALGGTWVAPTRIDWQPGLAFSEPWRAFSAVAVHYSSLHLVANLAGAVLVGALGIAGRVPIRTTAGWFVAWPLTQLGLLLQPELLHYGGLSGVLHAGVAAVAVHLMLAGAKAQRRIGGLTAIVLLAKLLSEAPWAGVLSRPAGWDIAVAPFAHVSGVACGTFVSAVAEGLHRLRTQRRTATMRRDAGPDIR